MLNAIISAFAESEGGCKYALFLSYAMEEMHMPLSQHLQNQKEDADMLCFFPYIMEEMYNTKPSQQDTFLLILNACNTTNESSIHAFLFNLLIGLRTHGISLSQH